MEDNDGNGQYDLIQTHHSKLLKEYGSRINELGREQKFVVAAFARFEKKIDTICESIGVISESYGKVIAKVSHMEMSMDAIKKLHRDLFDNMNTIDKSLLVHKLECKDKHRGEGVKDEFDVDTGVFSAMSGKQVKSLLEEERRERLKMRDEINGLVKEKEINDREKSAVALAKKKWETEGAKYIDERHKTRTARYGMYGAVAVAIITAITTFSVAMMRFGQ